MARGRHTDQQALMGREAERSGGDVVVGAAMLVARDHELEALPE